MNSLYTSLISYQIYNRGSWGDLSIPFELTEICNTNLESPSCGELVSLESLVTEGFLSSLPIDPQGSVSETYDGTGYFISRGSVSLLAYRAENKKIALGNLLPEVITVGADQISDTEWDLKGELTHLGASFEGDVRFEVSASGNFSRRENKNLYAGSSLSFAAVGPTEPDPMEGATDWQTLSQTGSFSEIVELSDDPHYFRAVSENEFGVRYGDILLIDN